MTTPTVGLHSLPTELKQQIVRCCRDQDIYLVCALEKLEFEEKAATNTYPRRITTLEHVARQNRSLTALASVSREWNEVAASVVFEAVSIEKLYSDKFLKRVLPRRGHHFVRLLGSWKRDDDRTGSDLVEWLVDALPQLPNLTQLYTPDLLRATRAGRMRFLHRAAEDRLEPDLVEKSNLEFNAQEEAILGLLERAETIEHPRIMLRDLFTSFEHISGARLKKLQFRSLADGSVEDDLPRLYQQFPNLESLEIHLELFDQGGGLNRLLRLDPTLDKPDSAPPLPRLRNLALTASYDGAQFYFNDPEVQPSFAPLLRLAHRFAETIQTLVLHFHCDDFDRDAEWDEDLDLVDYVADSTPLAFTRPFPLLHRLTLHGLASTSEPLLRSIDTAQFPSLKSCVCGFASVPDDEEASPNLAEVTSRLPGFGRAKLPREIDATKDPLVRWVRQREADRQAPGSDMLYRESTWPEPVQRPHPRVDATALGEQLRATIEHLDERYRRACDAQDPDALVQIREALERIDANRVVVEAWTGGAGSSSPSLENS